MFCSEVRIEFILSIDLMPKRFSRSAKYLPEWGTKFVYSEKEKKAIMARISRANASSTYVCAELYDIAYPGYPGDKKYYLSKAVRGSVLYVGIGSGRIFLPLTKKNSNIIGVDNSHFMLDLLFEKNPNLDRGNIIFGDVVNIKLPQDYFDAIIAPYSFLQLINRNKIQKVINNFYKWLKKGGMIYTDVFSPFFTDFQSQGIEKACKKLSDGTRIDFYLLLDHLYHITTEYAFIKKPKEKKKSVIKMDLSYYFPIDLISYFNNARFSHVDLFGGYHKEPFNTAISDLMVVEARK